MLDTISIDKTQVIVSNCNSTIRLIQINSQKYISKQSSHSVEHEYSIISSLNSPYIIKPIKKESSNTFIMEFAERGSLNRNNPITDTEVLINVFKQMCQAVLYLHKQNIAHLDLKLENFVEASDGTIKLIDFEHTSIHPESIKETLGTNSYNSSERTSGNYNGLKADIFSLGVCLTALMVGFIPSQKSGGSFASSLRFTSNSNLFWDDLEDYSYKKIKGFAGLDERAVDLINQMVDVDVNKRPDIETVLLHDFFEVNN